MTKRRRGLGSLYADLAPRLRALRVHAGLRQEDVGDLMAEYGVKCNRVSVAKIEAGRRPIRLAEAVVWAELAGLSLDQLVSAGPIPLNVAV